MIDLSMISLSKWPQMRVVGRPVTIAQAEEIVRRTDLFFTAGYGGNDQKLGAKLRCRFQMRPDWCDMSNRPERTREEDIAHSHEGFAYDAAWRTAWGAVQTSYVCNSWLACAFIGGPHGWCNPNTGAIYFADNVGKWPSALELVDEWRVLAAAFPFIDLGVKFMDRESCEDGNGPHVTLLQLRVAFGKVTVLPLDQDAHWDLPLWRPAPELTAVNFFSPGRECGVAHELFDRWERQMQPVLAALVVPPAVQADLQWAKDNQ